MGESDSMEAATISPEGANDLSPARKRWVTEKMIPSPEGTTEDKLCEHSSGEC